MNRGRRREEIFTSPGDYQLFREVLKETVEMHHLEVSAYCLMPNHYHLLVQTPEGNISRCMRHVNGVYTQRFNRRHGTDGQLFRGRYKAILVDDDNYLLEVLRYIHRNPVRAGMVKKTGDYNYSSHKAYISNAAKWNWLHKDYLLSMFSENNRQAVKAYKDLVAQVEPQEIEDFFSLKNSPSILGSQEFKDRIKKKFHDLQLRQEIPEAKILEPDPEEIKEAVCEFYQVTKDSLESSRRGFTNLPRDVAIYLVRRYRHETLSEIGHYFHMSNYSSVSSAVERVKRVLPNDKELSKQIKNIEKIIYKSQKQT